MTQKSRLPINGHFNIVHLTIILTSSMSDFNYRQFALHQKFYILSLKQAETPCVLLQINCPPVPKTNSVRKTFEWHWGHSAAALLKHTALHCHLVLFLFSLRSAKQTLHAAHRAQTLAASSGGGMEGWRGWWCKQALFIGVEINN